MSRNPARADSGARSPDRQGCPARVCTPSLVACVMLFILPASAVAADPPASPEADRLEGRTAATIAAAAKARATRIEAAEMLQAILAVRGWSPGSAGSTPARAATTGTGSRPATTGTATAGSREGIPRPRRPLPAPRPRRGRADHSRRPRLVGPTAALRNGHRTRAAQEGPGADVGRRAAARRAPEELAPGRPRFLPPRPRPREDGAGLHAGGRQGPRAVRPGQHSGSGPSSRLSAT